jgi:hypothetical protein
MCGWCYLKLTYRAAFHLLPSECSMTNKAILEILKAQSQSSSTPETRRFLSMEHLAKLGRHSSSLEIINMHTSLAPKHNVDLLKLPLFVIAWA